MSDMKEKLLEVIAAKLLTEKFAGDLKLPAPFGTMRWTGWKESWNSLHPHAQLLMFVDRIPGQDRVGFYVDLPSMQHGRIKLGGLLNIEWTEGSHELNEWTTPDEIREWFKQGMSLLLDDVLNEYPQFLENPIRKQVAV